MKRVFGLLLLLAGNACGSDASNQLDGSSDGGTSGGSVDLGQQPDASAPGSRSFAERCVGALVCEGFDTAQALAAATWPNSGAYPSSAGPLEVLFDPNVKASGGGSARFHIPAAMRANSSGGWIQRFGMSFGAHSTFYVQFRLRLDAAMASTNWEDVVNGGSSPKIAIIHNRQATCAGEELTINNRYASGHIMMYTDCGGRGLSSQPGTYKYASDLPSQYQNGYFNCEYPVVPHPPGGCFTMPADTWMTIAVKVAIGDWEQPNSSVVAWVAPGDGEPLREFIHIDDMLLHQDGTNEYDSITLTNYMTAFGMSQPAQNPEANSWYDELIISANPIPAPDGPNP